MISEEIQDTPTSCLDSERHGLFTNKNREPKTPLNQFIEPHDRSEVEQRCDLNPMVPQAREQWSKYSQILCPNVYTAEDYSLKGNRAGQWPAD